MANAYSHLHNFSNPIVDQGVDKAGQMLLHRQQKYDHNKQKLQSLFDEFSSLDMAKDVDKEYASERLSKIKELTNQHLQGVDLADSSFVSAMASNMSQFVDDNILNAVSSYRKMKKEDAEVEAAKKKNPDKYSDTNQQWAKTKSDRARYSASEEVGEIYGGGYGYVEYRDLQSKLSEHAPKIAKAIGAEYVVLGNGSGYFRSLDTYSKVDGEKLEAALDGLFDEKDKTQIAVNTWSTYGKMSDDQFKAVYTNQQQKNLAEADREIQLYENYVASTNDEEEKKITEESIKTLKKRRDEYEKRNNYDTVEKSYGRKALESHLYEQALKDPYLKAYSKVPELIESKAYQVDVETRKYELALAKAQDARDAAERKRLKEEGENVQLADPVARAIVTSDTDAPSLLSAIQEEEKAADEMLTSTVLKQFLPVDLEGKSASVAKKETDAAKAKMNKFLSKCTIEDLQGSVIKKTITTEDGKTEEVSIVIKNHDKRDGDRSGDLVPNEMQKAIGSYLARRSVGSPIKKAAHNQFASSVSQMEELLTEAVAAQSRGAVTDYDLTRLPSLKGGYRKDEKTGLFTYDENYPSNYYDLLRRKAQGLSVSEAGELTLKANIISHMLLDPEVKKDPALRRELEDYYENEVLSKTDGKLMRGASFSFWGTAANFAMGRFTPEYTVGSEPLVQALSPDYYLSAYTRGDFEGRTSGGTKTTLGNSPAEVLKEMKEGVSRNVKAEDYQNVVSTSAVSVTEDNAPKDRAILAGHILSNFKHSVKDKTPIIVTPVVSGGKLTGDYTVRYIAQAGSSINIVGSGAGLPKDMEDSKTISADDIRKMGITSFHQPDQPLISADVKNPHKEALGKVKLSVDSNFHKDLNSIKAVNKLGDNPNFEKFAKDVYTNYTVDLESYNQEFTLRLRNKEGEVVFNLMTGSVDYTEDQYIDLMSNANKHKERVILEYLLKPTNSKGETIKF